MITRTDIRELIGTQLLDGGGDKVGKIGQVFLDDETGAPEWATVNTGFFGASESFVPLGEAHRTGDGVVVPYSKDVIKGAPNVLAGGGHLEESQERELYAYYNLEYASRRAGKGMAAGHDTSGPNTDDAMTRSEERLRAGTEKVGAGKARLRKWVETEEVDVKVPVSKEKARLEREPITDANRGKALRGKDISEEEHEVTLTEERPVVAKETVPVERVRLTKDTEELEEQVSEEVRKERVAAEGDIDLTGSDRTARRR
jgi:uncharacterized protein (TIGR02271 family)